MINDTHNKSKWKCSFIWLFNLKPKFELPTDQASVLLRSFHLTSKCRYNASIRLKRLGRFTFLTTSILSLGLILTPMLLLANLTLAYPPQVINCLQLFLAVSVLVFSVISSTAGYEVRSKALNDCGDRIKDLSRELRARLCANLTPDLNDYSTRYSSITKDSEMHSRGDYSLAMLQASTYYRITGLPRAWRRLVVMASEAVPYCLPGALLVMEVILALDVMGVTHFWTATVLKLAAPSLTSP